MNVDECKLRDRLMIRLPRILYAFKFPEMLSLDSATMTEEAIQRLVDYYFVNDPLSQYALRALVNAAVEESSKLKGTQ